MALEALTIGSSNATQDPKIKTNFETLSGLLNSENKIPNTSLAANKFTWYTPKVIATEETRENVAFGTLATADEVKSVVLPENGLLALAFKAIWKSSVKEAGRAAIFIGANQLKTDGTANEVKAETTFQPILSGTSGLLTQGGSTSKNTTGEVFGIAGGTGGVCWIYAAAGTYNISLQFKATSGNVTAKERALYVAVLGA